MAYDGATKQVVLFGGDLYGSSPVAAAHYATDTWTWNGVNWTLQHPATAPPSADKQICAAYDPATRQVLMYEIAVLTGHSATWSWTGTNWVQLTVNAGPPMGSCSMAYDTDQHTMLMLVNDGGLTTPGMQVWRWDGASWVLTPMTMPIPTTYDMSIAYDIDAGEMVAVVSAPVGPPPFIWPTSVWQTWVLAGSSWSQSAVTTPIDLAPLAFDAATHQIVSIEASADDPLPPIRTWIYASGGVSNVSPTRVSGADREVDSGCRLAVIVSLRRDGACGSAGPCGRVPRRTRRRTACGRETRAAVVDVIRLTRRGHESGDPACVEARRNGLSVGRHSGTVGGSLVCGFRSGFHCGAVSGIRSIRHCHRDRRSAG